MCVEISKEQLEHETVNNMRDVINSLRRDKHDIVNHLSVICAMCESPKVSKWAIKDYIYQILEFQNNSTKNFCTGNEYVDVLLDSKEHVARNKNIKLEVKIVNYLTDRIMLTSAELVSVIGNLIDNAIDACESSINGREKSIIVEIMETNGVFRIMVSNNADEIPAEIINDIFKLNFSTKAQKSDFERGYGLFIVETLLKKRNGSIFVNSNSSETKFTIEVLVERGKIVIS